MVSCDVQSLHLLTLVYLDNQHCFFKSIFSEYSIYTDNYVCRLENLGGTASDGARTESLQVVNATVIL